MKAIKRHQAEGILYTDMYQLTMAQVYFRSGIHENTVQFDHFFRSYPDYGPHQAGYCINAGLGWLVDWMEEVRFGESEIEYLRGQKGRTGERLFEDDFLAWLGTHGTFEGLTVRAIPEGRVVHPHVPLTVVQGPFAMAQLLETALLNLLNYPILIATRAARMREVAQGRVLLEFGLRRAPERGSIAGARAALIGGADFTSNVGASRVLGYPPKGTHGHSMVQAFMALGGDELEAFRMYAEVYPDDCLLLVDTINTLESGIPNAIRVFEELTAKGHQPVGIRLDSGDLAYLSIQASKMLDEAGFSEASIVLSNQLDELTIWQIMTQIQNEARLYGVDAEQLIKRMVFGVGTRLITSEGDSSLDGVYKLVAVDKDGRWEPAIKLSETAEKVPNPGHKRAWRVYDARGRAIADVLSREDERLQASEALVLHHPTEYGKSQRLGAEVVSEIEDLHVDVWAEGKRVDDEPDIETMRARRQADLERLDPGVKRLVNPHIYHVSLTQNLWDEKQALMRQVTHG